MTVNPSIFQKANRQGRNSSVLTQSPGGNIDGKQKKGKICAVYLMKHLTNVT